MLIPRQPLSRRVLLRGLGVVIALPWLEAMAGRNLAAGEPGEPTSGAGRAKRFVAVYSPNGMYMPHWRPAAEGRLEVPPPILEPVKEHLDDLSVFSGLASLEPYRKRYGAGHAPGCTAFLTASDLFETHDGSRLRAGTSLDQVIAQHWDGRTRLRSLEMAAETVVGSQPGCDRGFSCTYSSTISWRTPTVPLVPEISPRAVFQRLFGDGRTRAAGDAAVDRSILDLAREDAKALSQLIGRSDQNKLDEYFTAIREAERRITTMDQTPTPDPSWAARGPLPENVLDPTEQARLLIELLVLALETDSTRVGTLMLANEFSNRVIKSVSSESHHNLSHHGNDAAKVAAYTRYGQHYCGIFAHLLNQLRDRHLLDDTIVLFGSGIGDGDRHDLAELPIVVAGGRGLGIRQRLHRVNPVKTPLANLQVGLLRHLGVPADRFGDSTGVIDLA